MAISPDELRNKTFAVVPKGYDRPAVNKYLGELAHELQQFNAGVASDSPSDESGPTSLQEIDGSNIVPIHDDRPAEATPREPKVATADDFDRVGAEISMMLRQAQQSALKIRGDAEEEARQLIDRVRIDIEADRVAHEHAAAELISRTEERATEIRMSAEEYGRETRARADEYAENRQSNVDAELAASESEAAATRQLTAEHLASANQEATTLVEQATFQARDAVAQAQVQSGSVVAAAQAQSDTILTEANASLNALRQAEERTRQDLTATQHLISTALEQSMVIDLDSSIPDEFPAEGQAS